MNRLTNTLLALLFCAANAVAQNLVWNIAELDSLRNLPQDKQTKDMLYRARQAAKKDPVAVTDKEQTRSGNKHNFEALSIYYWPNPDNPDGPYIVKDGQYNPEYKLYDLPRLTSLKDNLAALAKGYYLTQEQAFYDAYIRQLDTWFINKETRMNPDFEYNQFIPGRNNGKGCSAGIIDAYNFVEVIESMRLMDSVNPIGRKRTKAIKKWFKSFSKWMQKSEIGQGEARATNNHGTAYDVTLFYFSQYTGDKKICKKILKDFATRRILPQINDDGKQPEELKRTKAFHYSIYNLEHLVDFCKMQKTLGNDFLNNEGKRILSALEYLQQFVGRKQDFPYQEIGDWNAAEQKLNKLLRAVGK